MIYRLVLALLLAWASAPATAAITCTSVSSPGIAIFYTAGTAVTTQSTLTVTCNRQLASDPSSITYGVAIDTGNNPTATNGANSLAYSLGTDSACVTKWRATPATSRVADTITWTGTNTGPLSKQTSVWGCMTAQTPAAAGLYSASLTMTIYFGNSAQTTTGPFGVSIRTPVSCSFSTLPTPSTISLNYLALGPEVSGSATFWVQCTLNMPYTIAPDVPEGVLNNLRYLLTVSSPSATGTGTPQQYSVTARIPAGQAGTCAIASCTNQKAHTVVVTY
jgi:spore coat protein U-like protein